MKDIGEFAQQWMGMTDTVWEHHANPMSGWSRVPVLPLLALSIWCRIWIGWLCAVPIGLIMLWIWLNPRVFPIPTSTDNWMSKGVLGERVWLNKKTIPIARHHFTIATKLNLLAGLGMIPTVIGLYQVNGWMTISGITTMMMAKLWFLDRMVWLFEEMKDTNKIYASWLR